MTKEGKVGMNIMTEYKNECVGCPPERGCLGSTCPNRNIPYLVCDECGDECDILYDYDGDELCEYCLLDKFRRITIRV